MFLAGVSFSYATVFSYVTHCHCAYASGMPVRTPGFWQVRDFFVCIPQFIPQFIPEFISEFIHRLIRTRVHTPSFWQACDFCASVWRGGGGGLTCRGECVRGGVTPPLALRPQLTFSSVMSMFTYPHICSVELAAVLHSRHPAQSSSASGWCGMPMLGSCRSHALLTKTRWRRMKPWPPAINGRGPMATSSGWAVSRVPALQVRVCRVHGV